jgi:hypothetical protein
MNQPMNDSPVTPMASGGLAISHTHRRDWAPLPEQQDEYKTGEKHIGRPLDRFGDVLGPPLLELLARHDAVLNGEQRHQQNVDDERSESRIGRSRIDCLRYNAA